MTGSEIKQLAESVPKTPKEIGAYLKGLDELRPPKNDIERLEKCRQRLQVILLEAADNVSRHHNALPNESRERRKAIALVEKKFRAANAATFAYRTNEDGVDIVAAWNQLASVSAGVDEATIIIDLLYP